MGLHSQELKPKRHWQIGESLSWHLCSIEMVLDFWQAWRAILRRPFGRAWLSPIDRLFFSQQILFKISWPKLNFRKVQALMHSKAFWHEYGFYVHKCEAFALDGKLCGPSSGCADHRSFLIHYLKTLETSHQVWVSKPHNRCKKPGY